jgi:hypothetical protein
MPSDPTQTTDFEPLPTEVVNPNRQYCAEQNLWDAYKTAVGIAVLAERERCAKIARRHSNYSGLHPIEDTAWQIAKEIERAG